MNLQKGVQVRLQMGVQVRCLFCVVSHSICAMGFHFFCGRHPVAEALQSTTNSIVPWRAWT
jgi:hypothetical protein